MDAIVIGAGVLGTFHAYHLAKLGKKVVVFEKDSQPRQATVRNFGQVVPSGFSLGRWHYYGRYSTELYKSFQAKTDIGIHHNGSLYVASDPTEMAVLEEMQQKFAATDYKSELFSKAAVLDYSDRFQSDYVVGGLYFPQEVSADSRNMILALQTYLSKHYEVEFRYNTTVIDLKLTATGVEACIAGGIKMIAEKVFLCNGRDFGILFPNLFNSANIEVSKLQMISSKPVDFQLKGNILTGLSIRRYESFKSCETYAALDPENAHPELQKLGIHILFKQRSDGSMVIGDSHVYADAKTGFDAGFDEDARINELILEESKRILHLPNLKIENYWSGFYSQMKGDEEIFEYDIEDRIHIATAIGGKGMTASAGYAKERIETLYNVNSFG